MFLTGFADEAAEGIDGQLRALKALGWNRLEARSVDGVNIHDLDDRSFQRVRRRLNEAGVEVVCLGSTIANWSKSIEESFDLTLETVDRAIARMRALGTPFVRIMSYAVLRDADGRALKDQREEERFRRLREIVRRFADQGMLALHENCMNYGGMDSSRARRLLENVPGLMVAFDTGNAPLTPDFGTPFPYRMQSSWEYYRAVRDRIAYVHVKDARWEPIEGKELYCWPGEGDGEVKDIVSDLLESGYDGGFSIEPHMAAVYHDQEVQSPEEVRFGTFVEYGRRFRDMLAALASPTPPREP
jgi:sugar phosphate isomerase/epimerase